MLSRARQLQVTGHCDLEVYYGDQFSDQKSKPRYPVKHMNADHFSALLGAEKCSSQTKVSIICPWENYMVTVDETKNVGHF